MQTRIIRTSKEFQAVEKEWTQLLEESGQNNIFLTFDWLFTWWKYFGPFYSLFIILITENNKLVGIAPFMLSNRWGLKRLSFISHGTADYEDIITCGEIPQRTEIISAVAQVLFKTKGWDILSLRCLRYSSPNIVPFKDVISEKGSISLNFFWGTHKDTAPYISINDGWERYISSLGKKFLLDTKRQRSRLLKDNYSFIFKRVDEKKEILSALDKLTEWHIKRRKSQKRKSIFENPKTRDFLNDIAVKFQDNRWLDMSAVFLNSEIGAIHLGFSYKNTFFYYLPAFNKKYYSYSIGRLLLYDLLRDCFERRLNQFDFMLGEEDYKKSWNPNLEPLYFLNIYPRTVSGYAAYLSFHKLNIFIKTLLNQKW